MIFLLTNSKNLRILMPDEISIQQYDGDALLVLVVLVSSTVCIWWNENGIIKTPL